MASFAAGLTANNPEANSSGSSGPLSLLDLVVKSNTCCANEDPQHTHANLFIGDETLFLKSEADEQLLLQVGFRDPVRLLKLELGVPGGDERPKTVKVFANTVNMDFDQGEEETPTFEIDVPESDETSTITLNFPPVKFSKVNAFTLFVQDNHGNELTKVHSLKMVGAPVGQKFDVGEIHKKS